MLALDLPSELEVRLGQLLARIGREPADLVIEALAEQLDEIEDFAIAAERSRSTSKAARPEFRSTK